MKDEQAGRTVQSTALVHAYKDVGLAWTVAAPQRATYYREIP